MALGLPAAQCAYVCRLAVGAVQLQLQVLGQVDTLAVNTSQLFVLAAQLKHLVMRKRGQNMGDSRRIDVRSVCMGESFA